MKRLAALLLVVSGGCRDQPAVHLTWGGQNGEHYGDNSQPSTRQGPIVPCPNWGSSGGPVSWVIVGIWDPSGASETTFDCHDGGATIPVAEGSVTVLLGEGLNPGVQLGPGPIYTFTAYQGMTQELGVIDLDVDLWAPSTDGGLGSCNDDDCGGDPNWPF